MPLSTYRKRQVKRSIVMLASLDFLSRLSILYFGESDFFGKLGVFTTARIDLILTIKPAADRKEMKF